MPRKFHALEIDVHVPGRWYLSEPTNLDGQEVDDIWQFIEGRPLSISERLRVPIYRAGRPLDLDFAGAGQTPVVSARVAAVFRKLAPDTVQLIPVEVEGQSTPYSIAVVSRLIDAVDESACRSVERWTQEDGRPDRVGEYHAIQGLRIDPAKTGDARVFRLWGYTLPLIVDDQVKVALEDAGILGGKFTEV
ncbi:hypothetical protein HPC49_26780 [Pyxidicoccus fallax]|uniref:Immunity MXAN-0049 protein domain-containing protein n=1 Tax=Pyxidicoccus fallax TaxID=394095 RepID=A0A848LPH2_9BACT|nr:DUF1629 domain-containing protein [Pyxidicoccus fallax]NMO19569.1 hypothetical protein [Pyxidicoccus fallax]NPC81810.1 hypothetical protein [Pyxidicoccus fallax]